MAFSWWSLIHHRQPTGLSVLTAANLIPSTTQRASNDAGERSNYCDHFAQTVCSRRESVVDITGVVQPDTQGELEALRLYEKIIHDNPGFTSDQVDDVLVSQIYTEKRRQRLEAVFSWVVNAEQKLIERQPHSVFSAAEKLELIGRLRATKLELPPPASIYVNELDLFTKNDVYYENRGQQSGTIRVGGAYVLTAKSWFNRVFTFAHELAHSMDPCLLKSVKINMTAFDRLAACMVQQGMVKARKKEMLCSDSDQFSEAYADWIATKITAEALTEYLPKLKNFQDITNAVSNSVRDLCDQESWSEVNIQTYPAPKIRIGSIFNQAPQIQRLLGCEERIVSQYCEFN